MAVAPSPRSSSAFPAVTAAVIVRRSHRAVEGRRARLSDVGDAWRALLLGAPPVLL